jgi:hypothetical protein
LLGGFAASAFIGDRGGTSYGFGFGAQLFYRFNLHLSLEFGTVMAFGYASEYGDRDEFNADGELVGEAGIAGYIDGAAGIKWHFVHSDYWDIALAGGVGYGAWGFWGGNQIECSGTYSWDCEEIDYDSQGPVVYGGVAIEYFFSRRASAGARLDLRVPFDLDDGSPQLWIFANVIMTYYF